jgi:hypothetical protein
MSAPRLPQAGADETRLEVGNAGLTAGLWIFFN